jgi:lipoyl-dependent peroxiredoxin
MELAYTAKAKVSGGRAEGTGESSDGNLKVKLTYPKELGGNGTGTNPEQLFAIGYAACFEGAMKVVAGMQKVNLGKFWIDSEVMLYKTPEGGFQIGAQLNVNAPELDQQTARAVVDQAHQVCPYSKATRGNIDVKLNVVGKQ